MDLVTYGKILGGGFPLGAYGGRADLMDLVAPVGPVYQAGTLSANPVAVAAGLATVKKLKRENPYAKLEAETARVAGELRKLGLEVKQQASIFWIVTDRYPELFHSVLDQGFYLAPSAFEVGFVSTVHTRAENDGLIAAVRAAVRKALAK
jgi:glutamate-1-semialdehyde 2,1-aminomutase